MTFDASRVYESQLNFDKAITILVEEEHYEQALKVVDRYNEFCTVILCKLRFIVTGIHRNP